ncbi:MAG: class I SAM-dependent methyltransferase [Candidatus Rariloculaceae bacterium]
MRELLPKVVSRALDVGAGHGLGSYALASGGWEVTALEPDSSSLVGAQSIRSLAKESGLPINVVESVGETMPFDDATFDLVFARQVLHHAADLRGLCGEIMRVLKPGGTLLAIRDHVISKPEDLEVFLSIHPLHRFYGGENAYLLKDYIAALKSSGLVIDQVIRPLASPINFAPYTEETLRKEILGKFPDAFGIRNLFRRALAGRRGFRFLLSLASLRDSRPGRLYSFQCHRPSGAAE